MSDQELKEDPTLSPANSAGNNVGGDPDTPTGSGSGGNGASQKERRKIEIKFIENKTRRHVTFSKRKHGIMKKAFELSVLTGTQVLLLVVSETGLVYTFSTPKFEPIVTQQEGRNLIQACLNAPDDDDEEEEEADDEEAQRQQQQQVQKQQQVQQQGQQQAMHAQQQQQLQQQHQQMQMQQVPQQMGQPPHLHQLPPVAGDHPHAFSMDGFGNGKDGQGVPMGGPGNPGTGSIQQQGIPQQQQQGIPAPQQQQQQQQPHDQIKMDPHGSASGATNAVYQQYFQTAQPNQY
ncbi:transcription factor MCM1 KNAG_0H00480 [Huiozyma naganishii CBS 8797]|uniref:MADS-box domain-containing protein n=1 Tax=Huiozyma naganishii (strain ATCC MYA-139 / BCRC 22969 / CBS 8797 / KCTC 17520 / NBRC 10181 / NCYC 3082 / Yp74L-3) TaxID=1071383 RepID=J7S8D3_HUIN7|nr:hypothetical protein KNAG_0H00480 [Kazachstania naganishii CBS 8797]CCK71464.1 hypothetical protein KNAG_0H00480 [Kazachstania naganishii CBS 8797]